MPSTVVDRPHEHIGTRDLARWRTPAGRWLAGLADAVARRLGPHAALLIPLALGLAVLWFGVWSAGELYESIRGAAGISQIDEPMLRFMIGARNPVLNAVAIGFTQTGGPIGMPIIATLVTVFLAWRWKSWTPVVLMVLGVAGSLSMTIVGKRLAGRIRPPLDLAVPPLEHSPSLPSGHSLNSIVIGGLIAHLILCHLPAGTARLRALVIGLWAVYAFCMGLSRIYLGHHWASDVLFAWGIGLAWLAVVITAHRLFLTARRHVDDGEPAPELTRAR